ncbi:FERM, ARHGEF and pleckstrin domain-containing protein 2-like, partial [Gracilinanus agilis]|uniref:FERM, ARHGEF and pleckstrin domain-containing protein 2-like n=1 Tax=Gracilinanus agilis TaxID=191870 RepID=UPI001CFD0D95
MPGEAGRDGASPEPACRALEPREPSKAEGRLRRCPPGLKWRVPLTSFFGAPRQPRGGLRPPEPPALPLPAASLRAPRELQAGSCAVAAASPLAVGRVFPRPSPGPAALAALSAGPRSGLCSLAVSPEFPPRYLLGQGPKANTITHVCWYRNHSLSLTDFLCMTQNQLSGYLLRKFKNSSGWQKLWVVFTNFCLFFYKTHQDDYPLASLPLLGYTVSIPGQADGLHKDFVFKLQFKSHVYFFRAESKYPFE